MIPPTLVNNSTWTAPVILELCLLIGEPLILWGMDGEGKTNRIEATCRAMDSLCLTIILGNQDPTDLGGLPVVVTHPETGETHVVRVPAKPFYIARERAKEGKKTTLFFDEMNQTAPLTIAAAQNILSSFCAGDVVLDRRYVSMVAAANPPGIATGARNFKPPVCTRMIHIEWELPLREYIEGERSGWPDPTPIQLPAGWEEENQAYAKSLTTGFLEKSGEPFFRQDSNEAQQNWSRPTPRTWSRARRAIAALKSIDAKDGLWRGCLLGILGSGPLQALLDYRKLLGMVSPADVLADPKNVEIPESRDLTWVLCSALATQVREIYTWDAYNAAAEFYARIPQDRRDCCANSAISLAKDTPDWTRNTVVSPEWAQWANLGRAFHSVGKKSGE